MSDGVTRRTTLGALAGGVTPLLQEWYKSDKGDPGPQGYAVVTLAQLKAAPIAAGSLNYDGAIFPYLADQDYSSLWDDKNYIQSDHGGTGAWVRQAAASIVWRRPAANAQIATIDRKLREQAVSLLDFVEEADRDSVIAGVIPADTGFSRLMAAAVSEGRPAKVPKGSYKFSAQTALPASLTLLLEDGAELYSDDNAIESLLLVEEDNVSIYGAAGSRLRMPLSNALGLAGCCLLIRNTAGFLGSGIETQGGKYAFMAFDNDKLILRGCVARNSYRWGFYSGGNRNFRFEDCGVIGTRDSDGSGGGASDAFKIFGKEVTAEGLVLSTRSSYNGVLVNPYGIGTAGGQTVDIIATVDEDDDLYNIHVVNPYGAGNGSGLVEIKLDEAGGSFTNWPLHDITITGGSYDGDGSEPFGIHIADRVYNIDINGTKISNVQIGVIVANPARHVRLRNVTTNRTSREGIQWDSAAGAGQGCLIDGPWIIDPNHGQMASTYSGINLVTGSNVRIIDPTVLRSPVPAGSGHRYAISIGASCSNILIEGRPNFSGHVIGSINDVGTATRWPLSFTAKVDLASSAAQFYEEIAELAQAFYVTEIVVRFNEQSNVDRNIQVQMRPTASTVGNVIATGATGNIFTALTQKINPPVRVAQPGLYAQVQAVALTESPTGQTYVTVRGFYDGAAT